MSYNHEFKLCNDLRDYKKYFNYQMYTSYQRNNFVTLFTMFSWHFWQHCETNVGLMFCQCCETTQFSDPNHNVLYFRFDNIVPLIFCQCCSKMLYWRFATQFMTQIKMFYWRFGNIVKLCSTDILSMLWNNVLLMFC